MFFPLFTILHDYNCQNFLPLQIMLQFCIFLESKINYLVFPTPHFPITNCLLAMVCQFFLNIVKTAFHMHVQANLYVSLSRYPYCSNKKNYMSCWANTYIVETKSTFVVEQNMYIYGWDKIETRYWANTHCYSWETKSICVGK